MRALALGLSRNLAAGLALALFLPVRRLAFRVDLPQVLALFVVSALVDIAADAMRYGEGGVFSWLGLGNEIYSGGVLLLASAVLALLNRDRSLALAIPVIALATFPVLQVANGVPWERLGMDASTAFLVEHAVLAWILVSLVRIVYVALEYRRTMRPLRSLAGGMLLAAPIFFSTVVMPLEPWFAPAGRDPADPRFPNPASEPVMAEQARILDDMLSGIEENRPGVVDLYFAGFAGDGDDDAFRDDVRSARRVMDARWGTSGRSIVLVNHPLTLLTDPIASLSNLRATLDEFAAAMDVDEDVAMIYLAARGTPDGELEARMPPLDLVPITAARLRGALDDAGIRYRVIVVSACHAGGFLDELADDDTAVIVAATEDRDAPGCGAVGGSTPFGDAFFQDGMARAPGIDGAFSMAASAMAERQRADGMSPAVTPGSRIGRRIAAKLADLERRGGARQYVRRDAARTG